MTTFVRYNSDSTYKVNTFSKIFSSHSHFKVSIIIMGFLCISLLTITSNADCMIDFIHNPLLIELLRKQLIIVDTNIWKYGFDIKALASLLSQIIVFVESDISLNDQLELITDSGINLTLSQLYEILDTVIKYKLDHLGNSLNQQTLVKLENVKHMVIETIEASNNATSELDISNATLQPETSNATLQPETSNSSGSESSGSESSGSESSGSESSSTTSNTTTSFSWGQIIKFGVIGIAIVVTVISYFINA